MQTKPKRPRLEKTIKLIDKKMYEDYNQKRPSADDPNEEENTPLAPLPNSGERVHKFISQPNSSTFSLHHLFHRCYNILWPQTILQQ